MILRCEKRQVIEVLPEFHNVLPISSDLFGLGDKDSRKISFLITVSLSNARATSYNYFICKYLCQLFFDLRCTICQTKVNLLIT